MPSQMKSRRASKLKISLKSPMNMDDRIRSSTPQSSILDSKNYTKLSEKTKHVLFGKRSTSKQSRKRPKTKICFNDKRDNSRISKNKRSTSNHFSRSTSIRKKRKDMQSRYNINSTLFKSVDMKKNNNLYEVNRGLSNSLSKFDSTTLSLMQSGHKTSLAMYDYPNMVRSSKIDSKKSLFTSSQKSKNLKS